ncbi:hypothetical protein D9619_004715 [Psilocybe cf. subviscida]|uniref:Transmembrane protein n=1 Tax=Psilocybe cf. subviscida TaxID=2480587 RepID=A0A8H5F8V0_9AGAR|nr:hypothetical protein D9619_004715 [Psilocybe cf. subviscida]
MPTMSLSLVFLHLAPRLYITRVLIVACLCLVIYPLIWTPNWIFSVLIAIITLHHSICLMASVRFFTGLVDFILLIMELFVFTCFSLVVGFIKSEMPEKALSMIILLWVVWGSLILLTVFRLARIIDSRGRALFEPFNILPRRYPKEKKPHPFKMLCGRSLWSAHFIGETNFVRVLRGVLGLSFFAAVVFWIFKNVVYEPITETALGPVREFRTRTGSSGAPVDFLEHLDPLIWNIILPVVKSEAIQAGFNNSFTVDAIWTGTLLNTTNTTGCVRTEDPISLPGKVFQEFIFFQFLCKPTSYNKAIALPDLDITVDFTAINGILTSTWPTLAQVAVPISVGLTNSHGIKSIEDIFGRTPPVSLIPGMNVVSPYKLRVRQVFTNRALASLGFFQKTRAFYEPEILGFYPDPTVEADRRGPNIATLRLYAVQDWSDTRVVIDQRMNSVIAGFSDVGGLWTALNGIFAFIFGASMLHVLYGSKVLSIFGLAHSFHYDRMKNETLRLYPNIVKEHRDIEKRGLLALVKDHLIDLSFLEKEISYSENLSVDKITVDPESHLENMQESVDTVSRASVSVEALNADGNEKSHLARSLTDSNIARDPTRTPLMMSFEPPRHSTV